MDEDPCVVLGYHLSHVLLVHDKVKQEEGSHNAADGDEVEVALDVVLGLLAAVDVQASVRAALVLDLLVEVWFPDPRDIRLLALQHAVVVALHMISVLVGTSSVLQDVLTELSYGVEAGESSTSHLLSAHIL